LMVDVVVVMCIASFSSCSSTRVLPPPPCLLAWCGDRSAASQSSRCGCESSAFEPRDSRSLPSERSAVADSQPVAASNGPARASAQSQAGSSASDECRSRCATVLADARSRRDARRPIGGGGARAKGAPPRSARQRCASTQAATHDDGAHAQSR
jgi:hypothetical protein